MSILSLDEVPTEVYEQVRQSAAAHNRTISAEVVRLLQRGLQQDEQEARAAHAAALADLRRNRWTPPPGAPDSVTLLREDRER
jgi:plasmid stability protein